MCRVQHLGDPTLWILRPAGEEVVKGQPLRRYVAHDASDLVDAFMQRGIMSSRELADEPVKVHHAHLEIHAVDTARGRRQVACRPDRRRLPVNALADPVLDRFVIGRPAIGQSLGNVHSGAALPMLPREPSNFGLFVPSATFAPISPLA